jgi:hypothetical protein
LRKRCELGYGYGISASAPLQLRAPDWRISGFAAASLRRELFLRFHFKTPAFCIQSVIQCRSKLRPPSPWNGSFLLFCERAF